MTSEPKQLVEHFFRHEYGRLVAVLSKRLGLRNIDLAEDVAQTAIAQALKHWARKGIPDNPGGWLFQVATRLAIDAVRHQSMATRHLSELHSTKSNSLPADSSVAQLDTDEESIQDDQLQLLMACCHPELPQASSIALALKVMGGFSIAEIAHGLLTSQSNIQKRITRAKEKLREELGDGEPSLIGSMHDRIESVLMVIYLLFNEGYFSSHNEASVRRDLCDEAIRLARLIAVHATGGVPSTFALLALMSFHSARFDMRTDESGEVLLLELQDRSQWNWQMIREGMDWMQRSSSGSSISRFHIEAAIAWEHCRAKDIPTTDWPKICDLYDLLLRQIPSPIQWLNRAIAECYRSNPRSALALLEKVPMEDRPKGYPLWPAVLGYLHHRLGDVATARIFWQEALQCTHSRAEQDLLRRRIAGCQ